MDTEELPKFHTIKDLGAGGLYTYQEIRKAQDSIMFAVERNALNNIMVRGVSGQTVNTQGISMLNLFDKEELENLANSAIRKLYGCFSVIGEWTSGLLGIYFIFRIVKFVVEAFMNAVALHKLHGCSLHLIASFWDTLTLFILHKKQRDSSSQSDSHNLLMSPILGNNQEVISGEVPSCPGVVNPPVFHTTAEMPEDSATNFAHLRKELTNLPPIRWSLFERTGH